MPRGAFSAESSAGTLKGLFSGTAVLTLSAILTKLTGMVYRVPLIALVGTEGMAYFLAANHIYVLLFVISTAGLPVAVAVTVSEAVARGETAAVHGAYRTALRLFGAFGTVVSVGMIAGAGMIASWIGIPEARLCMIAIAPAVAMSCISGALRGYFQGHQIMLHTAISQLIEAMGKPVLGLAGAYLARGRGAGTPTVAAGAILGITGGVALSMLYLLGAKAVFDRRHYAGTAAHRGRGRRMLGRLVGLALPVTLSSAVINLSGMIDTALIPRGLVASGFSAQQAYTLFSCYGNMAIPLFSLTPALISPIAMSLVPLVASARQRGDADKADRAVSAALELTMLLALPATLGIAAFAEPILRLIFVSDTASAAMAAPLLSLLALAVVPACLITVTNAVLQAQGRAGSTMISMLCGMTVKLTAELILLHDPQINILGAPISTLLCDVTVAAVSLYLMLGHTAPLRGFWRRALTMAGCAAASVGGAWLVWRRLSLPGGAHDATVIVLAAAAAAIYLALAVLLGAVDVTEIFNKGSNKNGDGQKTENGVPAQP